MIREPKNRVTELTRFPILILIDWLMLSTSFVTLERMSPFAVRLK